MDQTNDESNQILEDSSKNVDCVTNSTADMSCPDESHQLPSDCDSNCESPTSLNVDPLLSVGEVDTDNLLFQNSTHNLEHSSPTNELNLSWQHFRSATELLKLCIETPNLKRLIIRDIWISEKARVKIPSTTPKVPSAIIKTLAVTCPQLTFLDITGCSGPTKRQLFGPISPIGKQLSPNNIEIFNFFDNNPLMRALLTPSELQKNGVKEKVVEIKKFVESGEVPANLSLKGWSLLHTACAIGDADLARWLIAMGGECKFQWKKAALSIIKKTPESMRPMDVAMALHYDQILDVFGSEHPNLRLLMLNTSSKMDWYSTMHNPECDFTCLVRRLCDQGGYTKQEKQLFFQSLMEGCLHFLSSKKQPLSCYKDCVLSSTVQFLLECGCSPNVQVGDSSLTPFHIATKNDNKETVRVLLRHGVDVNTLNPTGWNAMQIVAGYNRREMANVLLEHGANVNEVGIDGRSGLHVAAANGSKETMMLLLKHGARTDIVDKTGKTALHEAAENNASECAETLLDYGADIEALDKHGRTPLIVTASHNSRDTALALLKRDANTEITRKDGMMALHVAVMNGNVDTVEVLLENGAEVDAVLQKSFSFVPRRFHRYQDTKVTVARLRLRHGDATISFDNARWSALHVAARAVNSSAESTKVLLEHGANPNTVDEEGQTALHIAARQKNNSDALQILLQHRANVNAANTAGSTALHVACTWGRLDAVRTLLEGGANANFNDKELKTPGHIATEKCGHVVTELLLQYGADVNAVDKSGGSLLHAACRSGRGKTVELLLKNNALVDSTDHKGRTPLFDAVEIGYEEATKLLLKHGANVNILDRNGNHVLHVALKKTRTRIVQSLLSQQGIFVNVGDATGNSPLHYLVQCVERVSTNGLLFVRSTGKRLVESGAVVNARNHADLTPLHLARSFTAVEFLLQNGAWPNVRETYHGNTPLMTRARKVGPKAWFFYEQISREAILKEMMISVANEKKESTEEQESQEGIPEPTEAKQLWKYNSPSRYQWRLLLEKGLDPWIANSEDETLLSVLLSDKRFVLATWFINDLLVEDKQLVNKTHTTGDTLLHVACSCGEDEVQELIDQLLQSGAKCNVRNARDETPLHVVCKKVVEEEAKTSHTNVNDVTSESRCVTGAIPSVLNKGKFQGDISDSVYFWTVGRLLSRGADPSLKDGSGTTCFSISQTLPELFQLLQKPIDVNAIPALLKWSDPKSPRHKAKVAQVVRGQKSLQIQSYHYHCEPIGSGAFGHVYAGIDERDGREIAVKCIDKQKLGRPEEEREISNLLALKDCEEVVRYLCFLKDNTWVYIILELMEGTLEEYMDRRTDGSQDVTLCNDVVKGLGFLHHHHVLHRDIKPSNILYKTTPKVCLKIADFGLSTKSDNADSTPTVLHTNAGTRCWMAPELLQAPGKIKHTESSDMFACGLVLHFILSGKKHPFAPENAATRGAIDVMNATERNIMSNLLSIDDCLSAEAQHLTELMLNSEPSKRPTAADGSRHPLFWSRKKMGRFLEAVGNQPEIEMPRFRVCSPSGVEQELESALGAHFELYPWEAEILLLYEEMTSVPRARRYDTSSAVELVRFVRNSYAHVSSSSHSPPFKQQLLEDFVFFDKFPSLLMHVYKAVSKYDWDTAREEIKSVLQHE